ncbi:MULTISPECIES: ADP-ribosyltransferase [Yersinia]|uniref:ADP-ribosyltransferase n=1 Tax=Yersinia TaxID=629 RepID=UPI0005DABF49|nr:MULTISPECIES: ADP-ribosyltransferase [Yersinia]OVZ95913.1 hypothetical protein CBW53_18040 [Yersinia frederiksenii]RXA95419.1 hypothetical protein EQP49_14275 [Yersinia sp. 2105 StPb PI]CNI82605.1 Uncharacterised protein [Yersinia frederiksenii]CNK92620.1 Uncharacterised protein [Yersinia frederiksenii]
MFSVSNPSNTNTSCPLLLPELPFPEKQHLNYLRSMPNSDDVSVPVSEISDALNELTSIYSEDFLQNVTQLDIHDEIKNFNQLSAYRKVNFIDWFAFRDFKEDGYVRINNFLRESQGEQQNVRSNVFQMKLSLMHLTMLQAMQPTVQQTLFRGEVRSLFSTSNWTEGSIFSTKSFMSSSQDEDVAWSFCGDKTTLDNDSINVLFEIYNDNPYSGADISSVLRDGEDEFLFLPETDFIITDRTYDAEEKTLKIEMSTCYTGEHIFSSNLQALVFLAWES